MSNPMADRVHEFRIIVVGGMLLSLNCGFMNGATLLDDPPVASTHVTGSATRLGRAIAEWHHHDMYFFGGLMFFYICGSIIAGFLTPSKKFSISNRYGTVLFLSSILVIISSLIAIQKKTKTEAYDMTVAAATGILNASLSRYSGNIIRVGHVTGASVDIGVMLGRHVMGQKENLWKIQILVMLVFMFWLGGVLVQWIDPLLNKAILFVNSAYMIIVGVMYMLYWRMGGMEKLEKEILAKETTEREFKATLVSPQDPKSESLGNSSQGVVKGGTTNTIGDDGLVVECDGDADFNLTQEEADRLRVTVTVNVPAAPATIQDRSGVEFTFIMVGASLLAGNAGCVNAISSLSSRGLFTANVSGSATNFGLTAFSFDDSQLLMESTLVWAAFIGGSFISGLMSSTSVFRLGVSYGRILFLVTLLFASAATCNLLLPGSMLYYCFSSMACGLQNGMITKYSGGVVRTTNVTGGCADIGGIIGRAIKGKTEDMWQLKVLVPLVVCFIFGGSIGKVLYNRLDDAAPVVPAIFMGAVFSAYIIGIKFVSGTELSYMELVLGKYIYGLRKREPTPDKVL